MTTKKKILFCTESSHIKSGFGNFSRAIISRLYTDGYDVAELSCYRSYDQPKTEPWKIYPAAITKNHPNYQNYIADSNNQFGNFVFNFVLLDYQPDIVIDFRDFWMFAYQEVSPLRQFYHWLVAPTIDSVPLLLNTIINLSNADTVLTHTGWAGEQIKKIDVNNNINIGGVLSDSVDTNIFKPTHSVDIRKKYNIPEDIFVIGSVFRNQKRKLLPDLLSVTKTLLEKNNKPILLYLHTSYPEKDGWNLPELLMEYNLINHVLLTYKCSKCNNIDIKKFQYKSICKRCGSINSLVSVTNGTTPEELCEIYNIFDVYIQYAICEGFGIPQVEAVACGIPLITINHGAMGEIGNNLGAFMVDPITSFRDNDTNAVRVYPNNNQTINILQSLIKKHKNELKAIGENSRKLLNTKYSWDMTASALKSTIDNIQLTNLQGKWDSPVRPHNVSNDINFNGNNYEFVKHVVMDIIKDDFLMQTSFIQNMIHCLDQGYIVSTTGLSPYSVHDAIKSLDIYLKQKILLENIRTKQQSIPEALYKNINYA